MTCCDNCLKKINKECSGWVSVHGLDKTKVCRGYISGKPMTNADKIRAMSDEELAEFINDIATDMLDSVSYGTQEYIEKWEHEKPTLKWLQSEVKESEEDGD